jgi:hypothetical protein
LAPTMAIEVAPPALAAETTAALARRRFLPQPQ